MARVGLGMARVGLRMTCVKHGMAHINFETCQPRNRQHTVGQNLTKNPDCSTGSLARPFARSLAPLTRLLVPQYSLRSRALLRSLTLFAFPLTESAGSILMLQSNQARNRCRGSSQESRRSFDQSKVGLPIFSYENRYTFFR